jgi:hypothetical protein
MKITFRNDFHNTEASCRVHGDKLTSGQTRRLRKQLCGRAGCTCGGIRGPQDQSWEWSTNSRGEEIVKIGN